MNKLEIDHARAVIDALRASRGRGKTKLTDDQIAKGIEHYWPKSKVDMVVIDEPCSIRNELEDNVLLCGDAK